MQTIKSFQNLMLYGGLTKEEYRECLPEINESNRRSVYRFSVLGITIFVVAFLLSFASEPMKENRGIYLVAICVLSGLLAANILAKDSVGITNFNVYAYTGIMYLAGIYIGTITGLNELAVTFMVLLFVVPLLFITRPIYCSMFIIGADLFFVLLLHILHEDADVMGKNEANAVIFGLASVFVSVALMQIKIDRIRVLERIRLLSEHDQLTQLYNRRAFEMHINAIERNYANLVYASIDVNELKVVNDTLGHDAGDELLIGASDCMKRCLEPYGSVYRTGGDEFTALLFVSEEKLAHIKKDFEDTLTAWEGRLVKQISAACGYVSRREFPDASIYELSRIADERMYQAKDAWYKTKGVDRRGQTAAHAALCGLYTKILKINLTTDTYSIVNMDVTEQTAEKGFADSISEWLHGFGESGQVHPDDLKEYLEKTDLNYLKRYFSSGKTSISIFYRRKYADGFKQVAMEMIPANDYSKNNQALFLYVKNIDM